MSLAPHFIPAGFSSQPAWPPLLACLCPQHPAGGVEQGSPASWRALAHGDSLTRCPSLRACDRQRPLS